MLTVLEMLPLSKGFIGVGWRHLSWLCRRQLGRGVVPTLFASVLCSASIAHGQPQAAPVAPVAPAAVPAPNAPAAAPPAVTPAVAPPAATPTPFVQILGFPARLAKLTPPGEPSCVPEAKLEQGAQTYVACGSEGVWLVELGREPSQDRLIDRYSLEGRAVDLYLRRGRVWVELVTPSARLLESSPAGAPHAAREPEQPAPMPTAPVGGAEELVGLDTAVRSPSPPVEVVPSGRVLSSSLGELVIDLGRAHGITPGDHIELSVSIEERSPLGEVGRREVVAVGLVSSSMDERSLVQLGVGEDVPVGAEAVLTDARLTSNRSAPPRVSGVWSLSAMFRPFFVLDELGAGALNEIAIGYRAKDRVRYQLLMAPLGFAGVDGGSSFAALVVGLVSYDTRLFEIGLGFGAQTVNDGDFEPGSGLTVAQSLRFGSSDGLNFAFRNDISLFHSEFEYSAFTGQAQIPVSERGWLLIGGGGGTVGYGFFEMGGRMLLYGNGTRGSLFLRGTTGYAALFRNISPDEFASSQDGFFGGTSFDDVTYAGPLLGAGFEWRH